MAIMDEICSMISKELDKRNAENTDLRQRLAVTESKLERAQSKLDVLQGYYEDRYRLAEKAVMALIMDTSYQHGPVDLTVSSQDGNGDYCKSIVLHSAPDDVLRALVESDLVQEIRLQYDGLHIETIPERLDEMFGV